MDIISKSVCDLSLDFQAIQKWPVAWPAFAWDKKIISGFHSDCDVVLNFNEGDTPFLSLFHTCYHDLTCIEMGRIVTKWNDTASIFSWEEFFSLYNLRQDTDFLKKQFFTLCETPLYFQRWVLDKSIHLNELRIFASMDSVQSLDFIFKWLSDYDVSHAIGVKALELAGELVLMGVSEQKILNLELGAPAEVFNNMKLLRRPNSLSRDQACQEIVQKTLWPKYVNGQWSRRGDKAGLEIKIWSSDKASFTKQLEALKDTFVFDDLKSIKK